MESDKEKLCKILSMRGWPVPPRKSLPQIIAGLPQCLFWSCLCPAWDAYAYVTRLKHRRFKFWELMLMLRIYGGPVWWRLYVVRYFTGKHGIAHVDED